MKEHGEHVIATFFTTMPPNEWHTKIIGLCEASSSYAIVRLDAVLCSLEVLTSLSAVNCATSVCACCSNLSDPAIFDPRDDMFALYP